MRHLFLLLAFTAVAPGFDLLPAARCESATDRAQCEVARPKQWTDDERRVLGATLDRLMEQRLVRGMLAAIKEKGYTGLQRYTTDTQRSREGTPVAKFGPGFVLFSTRTIGITDAFFELAELRDARGGYRVGDLVLLHELAHAFDDRTWSTRPAFTTITGWRLVDGSWQYAKRVDISEYNSVFAQTLTLYGRGRHAEAWSRDRGFATALPFALPRIQALATPGETFADVLAHLILDPQAATYLPLELTKWFESDVFPVLLDLAK
jgi:hypothetical protein